MSEGKKSYAVLHFRKSKELVGLNLNPKHSQNVNHTKKTNNSFGGTTS